MRKQNPIARVDTAKTEISATARTKGFIINKYSGAPTNIKVYFEFTSRSITIGTTNTCPTIICASLRKPFAVKIAHGAVPHIMAMSSNVADPSKTIFTVIANKYANFHNGLTKTLVSDILFACIKWIDEQRTLLNI